MSQPYRAAGLQHETCVGAVAYPAAWSALPRGAPPILCTRPLDRPAFVGTEDPSHQCGASGGLHPPKGPNPTHPSWVLAAGDCRYPAIGMRIDELRCAFRRTACARDPPSLLTARACLLRPPFGVVPALRCSDIPSSHTMKSPQHTMERLPALSFGRRSLDSTSKPSERPPIGEAPWKCTQI